MVLAHNIDEGLRTRDIQIAHDVTFDTMLLASNTLQGLKISGFYKPSPVQLHGIPLGKCGFDLLLEAKSGTGKTAVFSVIALEKLDINKGLQVVILAPTREIAFQIYDVMKQIGQYYNGLVVEVVMGGLPVAEDIAKFKKNVQIVVGSPGRLRHLIQDKYINVSSVRLLVLDEADKLMEKSFLADINYIFSILPQQKQVIMSSATYPETTKTFINKYVKCAQHVCPDSNSILLGVDQKITIVKANSNIVRQTQYRFEELLKILSHKQFKQCLIFCNYQARVNELFKCLSKEKWPVEQLCGQQEQSDRLEALKTLQEYKCRILISTDLAARGIDASNVDLVINFEPPFEWQTYLHRIGRAGRYGSYGMAINILAEGKEEDSFKNITELINLDTLKITHFWGNVTNENELNISLSDKVLTKTILNNPIEVGHQDFWKLLVDNSNVKREIEDFETLFKSFEGMSQPMIESFTDLIDSYKTDINCNSLKESSNYQCTNIKPTVVKSLILYIKSLDINQDNINEIKVKPHKRNLDKDNNDDNLSVASITSDIKQLAFEENTDCLLNEENFCKFNSVSEEVEMESSSQALLKAGLPLSFGCPKKTLNNKGRSIAAKDNKIKSVEDLLLSCKSKSKQSLKQIGDTNHKHIIHRSFMKNQTNIENKSKYVNTVHVHNRRKEGSVGTNKKKFDDDYYSQEYSNWYKLLKQRVKCIELAVYMDEICRL